MQVLVDGHTYRVTRRPNGLIIYKMYPRGIHFKDSIVWDSRKNRMPQVGSTMARVLAAAGDV